MELRQLHYFLAVAETLHFGRAAERLHISQPPLTVQIQRLERELGVRLFDRSTRQVALTPEGAIFRESVTPTLRDLDEAVAELQDVRAGRRGRVRLGFVSSASYEIVPAAMRDLRDRHPGFTVELHPLTSGEQVTELLAHGLDVGIIRDPLPDTGLVVEPLVTEDLVAVLPATHPLIERAEVSPAELVNEPFILFPHEPMPGFHTRVLEVFRDLDHTPTDVQRVVNQENVVGLVAAGLGVSILADSITGFHPGSIVTRPISTRPKTSLAVVTRRTEPTSALTEFLASLRAAVPARHPDPAP